MVIAVLVAFGCGFLVGVATTVMMIYKMTNRLVRVVLDRLRGELGR